MPLDHRKFNYFAFGLVLFQAVFVTLFFGVHASDWKFWGFAVPSAVLMALAIKYAGKAEKK